MMGKQVVLQEKICKSTVKRKQKHTIAILTAKKKERLKYKKSKRPTGDIAHQSSRTDQNYYYASNTS